MQLYTESDVARTLNCSKATLRRMRREHRGPRWTKIGRLVRYSRDWLHEYVELNAEPAREQDPLGQ